MENLPKETTKLAVAATAVAVVGYGIWSYFKATGGAKDTEETKAPDAGANMSPQEAFKYF